MPPATTTPEQRARIARKLASQMRGWIVRKNDVPFMAVVRSAFGVARTLGVNVPSAEDFDRMAHAVGCFVVVDDDPSLETVAHECEHVGQFWRGEFAVDEPHAGKDLQGGASFVWLYLTAPLSRIRFELRAYRAGFEVRHKLGLPLPSVDDLIGPLFTFYALPADLREFAESLTDSMLTSVTAGVVTTDAGLKCIALLREEGVIQ